MSKPLIDRGYLAPTPITTRGDIACNPDELLDWAKSAVQDGQAFLRLQAAHPHIQTGLDMVNGTWQKSGVQTLSNISLELTLRNLKEIVAAQTNIRVVPAFKTEIPQFKDQCDMLNKCFMAWQQMTFADRSIRKSWQYAVAAGTGYIGLRWEPNYHYNGKGDIILDSYGPMDVLPLGMPKNNNLQRAYAVTLRVPTPLHECYKLWPMYASRIRPSRENSKGRGTVISQAVKWASAALRRFGPGANQEEPSVPWATVDVYYSYIDDQSVNETGSDVLMGAPGTSWCYTVPYVGKEIIIGHEPDGTPIVRKAEHKDCFLYPNKRLIISTDDLVLNPDPFDQVSPYWHGKYPIVQMRADDWPWMFLGMPLTRAGASIERGNNELMRGIIDSCNARLSPSASYDRNTMAAGLAEQINTRVPNQRIGLDKAFGGGKLEPFLPFEFYEFPSYIPELVGVNEQRLTHQMGVADAAALARARQLPAGDSVDKIMESLGPLIRDQSRNMEESIRAVGEIWKSMFFQFVSAARRMEMIGEDGIAEQDFDYDPGTLIPAPNVIYDLAQQRGETIDLSADGSIGDIPYFQRARWHTNNFAFSVVPYSLHELNSVTRKLFHLQLMRSGFPLDWWTLADLFDIKNFGTPPNIPDPDAPPGSGVTKPATTVMEKFLAQLEIQARIAVAQGAGGAPPGPGQGKHGGRPPSGQEPPTLEQRSGSEGTESVIRESRR